jgi:patatin-like phospholipase/acyl hydrolase
MLTFSDDQLSRQDFVDNSVHELLNKLNRSKKEIPWNIEIIGDIRDAISHHIVDNLHLFTEEEFYP